MLYKNKKLVPPIGRMFNYPKCRASSDCSFSPIMPRQASGFHILVERGQREKAGGGMGFIYLFFLLWGGATIEGRGHLLCCFFCLCRVVTQWRGHKHIEKPLFDNMVFFQSFKIILKFWSLEAIYLDYKHVRKRILVKPL